MVCPPHQAWFVTTCMHVIPINHPSAPSLPPLIPPMLPPGTAHRSHNHLPASSLPPHQAWFVTTCMHVIPINRRKFSQQEVRFSESSKKPQVLPARGCQAKLPCSHHSLPSLITLSLLSSLSPCSHHSLPALITLSLLSSPSPCSHHSLPAIITLSLLSSLSPCSHHSLPALITLSLLSSLSAGHSTRAQGNQQPSSFHSSAHIPFLALLALSFPPVSLLLPLSHSRLHHQLDTLLELKLDTLLQLKAASGPHRPTAVLIFLSFSVTLPFFLPPSLSHHQLDTLLQLKAASGPHRPTAVLIFPEGTRSLTGSLQPFKSGVGLLAEQLDVPVVPVCVQVSTNVRMSETLPLKSGVGLLAEQLDVPVVPVCVQGTFEALPKGRTIPLRRRVTVEFGRPLDVQEYLQVAQVAPPDAAVVSPPASTQGDAVQSTSAPGPSASEDTERAMRRAAHRRFADALQSSVADMAARSKGRGAQGETGTRTAAAVAAASFGGVSPEGISQASYAAAASLLACVPNQPGETAGLVAALVLCCALLIVGFRPIADWAGPYLFFPLDDQEEMQ
ncbi:unnamed protein product [Closterium sp. Naga37s-1]|nr:unnamed protein product [Closterium sp. Naga37s-1]